MTEGRLPKPQLRGHHIAYIKKHLFGLVAYAAGTALAYKVLAADVYKRKIEDFYKTYDPEKSLEKMNKAGLMHSCPQ